MFICSAWFCVGPRAGPRAGSEDVTRSCLLLFASHVAGPQSRLDLRAPLSCLLSRVAELVGGLDVGPPLQWGCISNEAEGSGGSELHHSLGWSHFGNGARL